MRGFRLSVALVTVTAALIALPTAGLAQETGGADIETTWIVVLDDSLRSDVAGQALLRGLGTQPDMTFGNVLNGFTFRGDAAAADTLRNSPSVRAVVPDGVVTITEPYPPGIDRIDADEAQAPAGGDHTGAGVRIVVIDTGIDLDHPDLVANIDPNTANHLNCQNVAASVDDDQGHGTHVSGTAAAALNGLGVIGVAPEATIVPVKAFGADGQASTSEVICGVDHAAALALDGTPTVVNMSFSEGGPDSVCDDADVTDVMHEAICDLVDAGAVPIAASGNSFANSANTMPANFAETITVSAITDLDGIPGAQGGCQFDFLTFLNHCDDTYAGFSNYGSVVDVIAPGSLVNSTRPGGSYGQSSGTSMSTPHVAGVAALMLAADPTLDVHAIRDLMQETGECSDGSENGTPGACSASVWPGDPDGIAEPLVDALAAAQAASGLRWVSPHGGELVEGIEAVQLRVTNDVPAGTATVEWRVNAGPWQGAGYNPATEYYEASWDTSTVADGDHFLEARVTSGPEIETADITVQKSAYASAVIADAPIALWRLDDSGATAVDSVGSHHSSYVGNPALGTSGLLNPDPNSAAGFDGVDDLIAVPGASDINTGGPYTARTVEMWFQADDVNSRQVLFESGGTARGLAIYLDQGEIYFIAWNDRPDDPTSPWGPVWVSTPVVAGGTYHAAIVLDQAGGELTGYLNGAAVGTADGVGNLFSHSAKVAIGAMDDDVYFHDGAITNPGRAYHFGGTIDEVAVYNAVLSAPQLANHSDIGGATAAVPPSVSVEEPTDGATLSGTTPIEIAASDDVDPPGSLDVTWRIDGGPWTAATYNGASGLYESAWDTTSGSSGPHTVEARAIDSDFAAASDSVSVTVDNSGPYQGTVIADGAIAFWRLDDAAGTTAVDVAGNHNSTYQGSPALGTSGLLSTEAGNAVGFDGVNDLVAVPGASDINTGGPYAARTIELWFQADDVDTRQVLFEEGGSTRGLAVYLDQGSLYFNGWNTTNDDSTTPWGPVWVSSSVAAGIIYHVVLVHNQAADELTGFVNGSAVGTASGIGRLFKHTAKVGIGAMNDDVRFHDGAVINSGNAFYFDGVIDEVALYNTALTPAQVANHAAIGGASGGVPPTVTIESPADGAVLSGDAAITVQADDDVDPAGTLTVEWRVDSGPWSPASYNAGFDRYEATWDTTTASNSGHVLQVRAIDSDAVAGSDQASVTVNNSSGYAGAIGADGAIAYWRLNETAGNSAADSAGSHDATYSGSPTLGAPGLLNSDADTAVDFDGVDDLVAISGANDINTGGPYAARTIELWFNADDVTSRQVLFEEGGISRGLAIYIDQGSVYFIGWNNRNDDPTTPWGPLWLSAPVTAGSTYHVALVLDRVAGELTGYVDGLPVGSQAGAGNLFKHNAKVAIGAMSDDIKFHDGAVRNSGKAYHFAGTIDEVALYNTALSTAQIANHTALGNGPA